jgi:aspartate/tyrosine/aromatic aminotransferase
MHIKYDIHETVNFLFQCNNAQMVTNRQFDSLVSLDGLFTFSSMTSVQIYDLNCFQNYNIFVYCEKKRIHCMCGYRVES